MKNALQNLFLFAAMAIVFSGLTGCGGPAANNSSNGGTNTAGTNANTQAPTVNASDYPPLKSALADGEIQMLDGTKSKLSDRKGKVLVVNLWATWCGPCRAEMPQLVAMQNEFGPKGFTVIGLDIGYQDTGEEEPDGLIKSFVEKQGLNYEIGKIKRDLVSKFETESKFDAVPQNFLIDRQGRLRGVFTGGSPANSEKIRTEVAKLLEEQ